MLKDVFESDRENLNKNTFEIKEISGKVIYREINIELPEDIETLKKIALMKKQNPNQKEFEID
ncbi:TPA: hypothetical protein EYP13_00675 [Candidatus Micrarchaeota archaeon]|nr:hypothetical protein [Candidatus Micrarchaeota archaeon]